MSEDTKPLSNGGLIAPGTWIGGRDPGPELVIPAPGSQVLPAPRPLRGYRIREIIQVTLDKVLPLEQEGKG